jgi:hypothetical protein
MFPAMAHAMVQSIFLLSEELSLLLINGVHQVAMRKLQQVFAQALILQQ